MTTTKRRTFSQRHYLAVIRGDFKVLWRYAIHGEPTAPQARSLVGMSQSQRKRKARELAFFRVKKSVLQAYAAQAETMQARERGENVVNPWDRHYLTHREAYQQARRDYRIGQRLRPCPGCPACDEPRSSVRQLRGWVRLAGLRLFAWKRIATEPCNGFTGRWSAGWTVHLRTGERIGGAWRDDDLRAVWETAAQHCLNGMRKALGSAPRCDGSGVISACPRVNQGKPLAVEPADDLG